jgi:hypothetical protein
MIISITISGAMKQFEISMALTLFLIYELIVSFKRSR